MEKVNLLLRFGSKDRYPILESVQKESILDPSENAEVDCTQDVSVLLVTACTNGNENMILT
jgi:hypothetical protein